MRNPLADPYVLGISAGASFGAVIVFVGLGGATLGLTTGAFGGAMVSFLAVLVLGAGRSTRIDPARIVLAGVAVAALFDAATSLLIIAAADPAGTRGILYWLLGSLAGATWSDLAIAVPLLLVALGVMLAHGRALNAMAIGDDDAAAVGRRGGARALAAARRLGAADGGAGRRQRRDRLRRACCCRTPPGSSSAAITGCSCRPPRSSARRSWSGSTPSRARRSTRRRSRSASRRR